MKRFCVFFTIFILLINLSGCFAAATTPSPTLVTTLTPNVLGYDVVEFSFGELVEIPEWIKQMEFSSSPENEWIPIVLIAQEDFIAVFERYVGKEIEDFFNKALMDDKIVVMVARFGYSSSYHKYSSFKVAGLELSIFETEFVQQVEEKQFWLDFVVIPQSNILGGPLVNPRLEYYWSDRQLLQEAK